MWIVLFGVFDKAPSLSRREINRDTGTRSSVSSLFQGFSFWLTYQIISLNIPDVVQILVLLSRHIYLIYMCVYSILLHVPFQGVVLLHIRYFVPADYRKLLGTAVWPLDGLISRNNLLHRACESSNSQQVVWQRWQRQTVHLQTCSRTQPLQVSLGNRL